MSAAHLEILVEEPSMEAFLRELLPRLLPARTSFHIYPSQCKDELLQRLPDRLRGYGWLPDDWRIVVIVDRDDDDCVALKQRMEAMTRQAGLRSRTASGGAAWQIVNRIAIEELEAWYFGDWESVCESYPGLSKTLPRREGFRDPDAIRGGTWEAFERVLKQAGYFRTGLRKTEVARTMGRSMEAHRNASRSFAALRDALLEAAGEAQTA
jgi:hypothetical protein